MKEIRRALVILFGVCGFIAILHLTDASLPPSLLSPPHQVDANEEAASKSNIRTIPTFHFYRKGKLVGTFAGADQKKLSEGIEDLEARP